MRFIEDDVPQHLLSSSCEPIEMIETKCGSLCLAYKVHALPGSIISCQPGNCIQCGLTFCLIWQAHSAKSKQDLTAYERFDPPKLVEVTSAIPNKPVVGKAFKKDAKAVQAGSFPSLGTPTRLLPHLVSCLAAPLLDCKTQQHTRQELTCATRLEMTGAS